MTGLFLAISFFWLLPSVCLTLDIPLQSSLLIRGQPVGFIRTTHRQKRSALSNGTCNEDEYTPKRASHCCNKCLAGFRVVSDCPENGKTICTRCLKGYFNKSPNYSKTCKPCSECYSQFGQIVKKNCTPETDTVCGCPTGYYKLGSDQKFECIPCSTCRNTSELQACKPDHDTICKCLNGFYHDATKKCRPCTECDPTEDCSIHCPSGSIQLQDPDVVPMILAGVLAVALLAVVTIIIVKNRQKFVSALKTKRPLPVTDVTGSSQLSTPLMTDSTSPCKLDSLPGHAVYVMEDPVLQHENKAQNSALPLPDITLQTKTPCLNSPEVLYKVIECIPVGSWREFIRRLGVSNYVIETSEQDYRRYKDAQYAMLSSWVNDAGSTGATRDTLFKVLREMNLGGCIEKIEESL